MIVPQLSLSLTMTSVRPGYTSPVWPLMPTVAPTAWSSKSSTVGPGTAAAAPAGAASAAVSERQAERASHQHFVGLREPGCRHLETRSPSLPAVIGQRKYLPTAPKR